MKATEQYFPSRGAVYCATHVQGGYKINVMSVDEILKHDQLNEATEQYFHVVLSVIIHYSVQSGSKACVCGSNSKAGPIK